MPKYVIEREHPGAGKLSAQELQGIAQKSCGVLNEMGRGIQWVQSYVTDDKVYCVAGRTVFLDGGLRLLQLHPRTGEKISEIVMDEIDPKTGKNLHSLVQGLDMPVGLPDILSSDGKHLHMLSQLFDLDCKRLNRKDAHLFSPAGLLDDRWHHRSYWIYGPGSSYHWPNWFRAGLALPAGRILSFDDDTVYGFSRKPEFFLASPVIEYQLYRADKKPDPNSTASAKFKATHWLTRGEALKPKEMSRLKYHWIKTKLPMQVRAMVLTKDTLFVAGLPDTVDEMEVWKNCKNNRHADLAEELSAQTRAWRGQAGGSLWAVSTKDGAKLAEWKLESPPVFDGMIAAGGRLYLSLMNGSVVCMQGANE